MYCCSLLLTVLQFKDMETMRLCLKYFRQKNLMDVFHLLKNRIDVELEHPIISSLHHQLVLVGDFDTVEKTLETLFETEVFESHCQRSPYTAIWKRMSPIHENGTQKIHKITLCLCVCSNYL